LKSRGREGKLGYGYGEETSFPFGIAISLTVKELIHVMRLASCFPGLGRWRETAGLPGTVMLFEPIFGPRGINPLVKEYISPENVYSMLSLLRRIYKIGRYYRVPT
jgi:hypothetical protein